MLTNCILIVSNFACRSSFWLQIEFVNSLFFYLFTFAINLWHRKFVTVDDSTSLPCLSTINDEDKILMKILFAISMGRDSLF